MLNTTLPSQYFWLLQQGRRPMDYVHTILLIGGYDRHGRVSNQIDQITLMLPPLLAVVSDPSRLTSSVTCQETLWHANNLWDILGHYGTLWEIQTWDSDHHRQREVAPLIRIGYYCQWGTYSNV